MRKVSSFKMEGISQNDRYPDSLRPDFFQPEERTEDDLLIFTLELSKQLTYFNIQDQPDGTWEDFFLADPVIATRIFSKHDLNRFTRIYEFLAGRLQQQSNNEPDEQDLTDTFRELMNLVHDLAVWQIKIHRNFNSALHDQDYHALDQFKKIVTGYDDYTTETRRLLAFYEEAKTKLYLQAKTKFDKEVAFNMRIDTELYKVTYEGGTVPEIFMGNTLREKIAGAMVHIDQLFSDLGIKYNRLAEACRHYRYHKYDKPVTYEPHIGLLLAFLGLYHNLKQELNKLPQEHLEFYYKNVLGIKPRMAIADKVHILFSLNPSVREFTLKKGETVLAEIPGRLVKEIFTTDEDILLNHTKVEELKTLYRSEIVKIASALEDDTGNDVKEFKVYCTDNPVCEPIDFYDNTKSIESWPVLGEDQEAFTEKIRTMKDADLGLLVASPLLYATDGKRTFTIRFYITDNSYNQFISYVRKYEKIYSANTSFYNANGSITKSYMTEEVIKYDMLNNAFRINITGPQNWINIARYSITLEQEDKFSYFQVEFELNHTDPAVQVYNSAIHGFCYETQWPVVRLLLNNNAFYNPYTFFQQVKMNRITVHTKVEGSSQLQLQNNFGLLSMASPFQAFGPQPEPGSYIDIRNTNIFNRYTKDFSIRFNWFDLPKDSGGFETYFQAYGNNIKNDSFKVAVSGLEKGRFWQGQKEQVMLELFQMRDQFLDNETIFTDPRFSKIAFDNELLLLNEGTRTNKNFSEGTVRIELLKPEDCFGGKLYPVIFPATVLHNSSGLFGGLFKKKLPVPNLPYAPRLQAVTINYELEYSEELAASKSEAEQRGAVALWHYLPFGDQVVYPGKIISGVNFIPSFQHKSNLYIGLNELSPGKDLNLLFQLDEHNFFPVEDPKEQIRWSYLVKNEWIPFQKEAVLKDDTMKFIYSGIVKLKIPGNICTGNFILNPSLYWLRASCNTDIRTRVKAVFAHAVIASRTLDDTSTPPAPVELMPGLLKEFSRKIPEVLTIYQPFRSFGGKAREADRDYYIRVSEMLRNKQRLITAEDIAQYILERYPKEVNKVICYNGTAPQYNYRPGAGLQVVLLPLMKAALSVKNIEPRVKISTIYRIKKELTELLSPFVRDEIEVRNPDYERLKVVCSVVFRGNETGENSGNFSRMLNTDLKKVISPWAFGEDAEIINDGYIYPLEILNFLKKLPYVQYVTGFTMLHFFNCYHAHDGSVEARVVDHVEQKLPFLKIFLPGAIFISSETHNIKVIQNEEYEDAPKTGIRELEIGNEFLIGSMHDKADYLGDDDQALQRGNDEIDIYFNSKL